MQSPFKIFRKHQKVVLAGLTSDGHDRVRLGDTLMKMVRQDGGSQASQERRRDEHRQPVADRHAQSDACSARICTGSSPRPTQESHPEIAQERRSSPSSFRMIVAAVRVRGSVAARAAVFLAASPRGPQDGHRRLRPADRGLHRPLHRAQACRPRSSRRSSRDASSAPKSCSICSATNCRRTSPRR